MPEPCHRLKRLTLAYASALVLLIVAADRGVLAVSWLAGLPYSDKVGHFLLIGFLSYLANVALGGRRLRWRRLSVLKGSVLVAALVAGEEISQLWISNWAFEFADLAADLAGIWVFGLFLTKTPPSVSGCCA